MKSRLQHLHRPRVLATVGVIAFALGVTFALWRGREGPEQATGSAWEHGSTTTDPGGTATTSSPATTVPAPGPAGHRIATNRADEIRAFASPSLGADLVTTLPPTTLYGVDRTFLVVGEREGWLEVLLPIRPNGTRGWVQADEVSLTSTTYSVVIDLDAHRVRVYDGFRQVLETGAVIGSPSTPTPLGTFYVTDPIDRRSAPDSVYGAYALGLSGYSEVLEEFDGGPAQIALHGTNRPDQLGQEISNGCIRVPDDVIVEIASTIPVGTPVHVVA